ncbi:MAG TPA: response regulator transcription factor [Microbacterium sp.]|nr:response regulator transcription factor [Microbacterium sp.]
MRVVICDDHPVYRDGLRSLLLEIGVEVVGEAGDGEESISLVREAKPDVVIMDLHLPGMSGIQATRRMLAEDADLAVLILTMLDDRSSLFAALRAGARGYLLKGAGHDDIAHALAAVQRGDLFIGSGIADEFRWGISASVESRMFPQLTPREHDVLSLVARGRTNAEIASDLIVSDKTVRNVVSSVMSKLGASSRASVVALARDAGMGEPGP